MEQGTLSINEILNQIGDDVIRHLADYTVGFVKITDFEDKQEGQLLGSGTLVKFDNVNAILTAHHVMEVFPKKERLGLILDKELHRNTIDINDISKLKIARGKVDSEGPDLALVILSPTVAATIGAKKSFLNLKLHRKMLLENPPDMDEGIWVENGFVDERTETESGQRNYSSVNSYYMMSGIGVPDKPAVERMGFDYINIPITYGPKSNMPISFEGMSGGGLWQILVKGDLNKKIEPDKYLLSGVVFYQGPLENNQRRILCHSVKSIYETVIGQIRTTSTNGT